MELKMKIIKIILLKIIIFYLQIDIYHNDEEKFFKIMDFDDKYNFGIEENKGDNNNDSDPCKNNLIPNLTIINIGIIEYNKQKDVKEL